MATIPYQKLVDKPRIKVLLWEALTETNADGQPYEFSGFYPDKCAQVIGNFGSSGAVVMQGTNNPGVSPTFTALNDVAGDAINVTAAAFIQVLECPHSIRPFIGAGTGVDVDVYLIMRKF